jgi:hypothetical protein
MEYANILYILFFAIALAFIVLIIVLWRGKNSSKKSAKVVRNKTISRTPAKSPIESPAKLMVMTGPLGGQTFYYCHPALQICRD